MLFTLRFNIDPYLWISYSTFMLSIDEEHFEKHSIQQNITAIKTQCVNIMLIICLCLFLFFLLLLQHHSSLLQMKLDHNKIEFGKITFSKEHLNSTTTSHLPAMNHIKLLSMAKLSTKFSETKFVLKRHEMLPSDKNYQS